MPDAFFAGSNSKKRKRVHTNGVSSSNKAAKRSPGGAASSSSMPRSVKNGQKNGTSKTLGNRVSKRRDEELEGDSDAGDALDFDEDLRASDIDEAEIREQAEIEDDDDESPAEKRLRLAKLYLESVKNDLADGEWDAAEIDKEVIQSRLQKDVLEQSGKVHSFVAEKIIDPSSSKKLTLRPHRLPVTAAVVSEDLRTLFTSGKEGNIVKHDLISGNSQKVFHKHIPSKQQREKGKGKGKAPLPQQDVEGHLDEVWALALSPDGKWLASGGKDRRVGVWDVHGERWVKSIGKHKDSVSALAFRKGTQHGHSLYSASFDRTVQVFTLPTSPPSASGSANGAFGYVETLFGHQDKITDLDALRAEAAVSSGGRDKTVRFFKIADETQLVFRGGVKSALREVIEGALDADADMDVVDRKGKGKQKFVEGSMECVAMIDEHTFLSGGDSGSISLWSTGKKKPIFNYPLAHGVHIHESETEGQVKVPRWVTSLTCLRYSDLFASGSYDGHIRLWKLDPKLNSFQALPFSISIPGIINSLQLVPAPHTHNPLLNAPWLYPLREIEQTPRINGGELEGEFAALLVAGVGQEPRLGRWLKVNTGGSKNCALVVPLRVAKS